MLIASHRQAAPYGQLIGMDDRPDPLLRTSALPAGQDWWKRAVFYQLSPRAFQDSDGDGVGDLGGVLRRLSHLDWLGVDAVCLGRVFPAHDAGSTDDISSWMAVDPQLGTIDQLDELIARLHERAQRLLLDLPPNLPSEPVDPKARAALRQVAHFWLDRGIDGFRLSARAPTPGWTGEIRAVVDQYPGRVVLGEAEAGDHSRPQMPLNPALVETPWDAASLNGAIDGYLRSLGEAAWPNWMLDGPGRPRVRSRLGSGQAANAAVLLLTLPGSAVFQAGDEIGMADLEAPEHNPNPAPFRWDATEKAGFTTGEPFAPVGGELKGWNLADQKAAPRSLLQLYRRLIELRHRLPVLQDGRHERLGGDPEVLSYRRVGRAQVLTVALNLTAETRTIATPPRAHVMLSTCLDREGAAPTALELRPHEGVIFSG